MNVAIVGLGLIGGSMAKSIKNRTSHTVWGIDLNAETMTMARMCGAIDAPLTEENLPQADLILVAIRPGAAIEWVRQHAPQIAKSAILVDLCGVKRTVVAAIAPIAEERGFSYIGGHPMAGKERGGFTASAEDLYVGASMILTPDKRTDMRLLETPGLCGPHLLNAGGARPHHRLYFPAGPYRLQRLCEVAGGPEAPRLFRRQLSGYDPGGPSG